MASKQRDAFAEKEAEENKKKAGTDKMERKLNKMVKKCLMSEKQIREGEVNSLERSVERPATKHILAE